MNNFSVGMPSPMPPAVKNLLIINALAFFAYISLGQAFNYDLNQAFGLHYVFSDAFNPIQFITYMFLHGGFSHIFFNMFALWMFGKVLEQVWGTKRFLIYYFVTGLGAALFHMAVNYIEMAPVVSQMDAFLSTQTPESIGLFIKSHKFWVDPSNSDLSSQFKLFQSAVSTWMSDPYNLSAKATVIDFMESYKTSYLNAPVVVGASGAVFGLLLAFGMLFPNSVIMLLIPPIPIKAKYFVLIYGLIELFFGFAQRSGDNVAHFAHLGGMVFGVFMILYWKRKEKNRFMM